MAKTFVSYETGRSLRAVYVERTKNLYLFPLCFLGIGLWFLLDDFSYTGTTYDEFIDFKISKSFIEGAPFSDGSIQGSQGRFIHLFSWVFLKLFGVTTVSFKLASIVLGILSVALFILHLRKKFSLVISLATGSLLLCSAYYLGSARHGGTAGEVAVIASWLLFYVALEHWSNSLSRMGALYVGAALGIAVAAKWTAAVLALLPIFTLFQVARKNKAEGALQAITIAIASGSFLLLFCPTLLGGPEFIMNSLKEAAVWDQVPEYYFIGGWYAHPPFLYLPAVILAKFWSVLPLVFYGVYASFRSPTSRRDAVLLSALALLPAIHLSRKFQSANYYLPMIVPFFVFVAYGLQDLLQKSREKFVSIFVAFALVTSVAAYLNKPDFLQAGQELGEIMLGDFAGPAILHCQGGSFALETLNSVNKNKETVYLVDECAVALWTDISHGPVKNQFPLQTWDPKGAHPVTYYLLIPKIFNVSPTSNRNAFYERRRWKKEALQWCQRIPHFPDNYEIYHCNKT